MSRNLTERHIIELVKQHFSGGDMPLVEDIVNFITDLFTSKTLWLEYGEYVDWESASDTPSTLPDGTQVNHPMVRKQTFTQNLLNGAQVEAEYCTMWSFNTAYRLCKFTFTGVSPSSWLVFPYTSNPSSTLSVNCSLNVFTQTIETVYENHKAEPDPDEESSFVSGVINSLINAGLIVETTVLGVATYMYILTIDGTMFSRPMGFLWKCFQRGSKRGDVVEYTKWSPYFTFEYMTLYPFYNAKVANYDRTAAFGTAVKTTSTCPESFIIQTAYPI